MMPRARRRTTWADEVRVRPPRWVGSCFAAHVVFLRSLPPDAGSSGAKEDPSAGRLLLVAAELLAHRGEHLVGELTEALRRETRLQSRRQHGRWDALVDGSDRGPPTLAGIRDPAGETLERGRLEQRRCAEVQQPRCDDAPPPPQLGDVGDVEVVLVELR